MNSILSDQQLIQSIRTARETYTRLLAAGGPYDELLRICTELTVLQREWNGRLARRVLERAA
ncbi:hypothetical protein [Flaviaesturariibacter amylovorans]|uniref:Uncharacterized protein n=1 Tax=Flaviaesturariibacter amylovorans TaxID=1084520 RepID=A0ABP8HHV9_9BACT